MPKYRVVYSRVQTTARTFDAPSEEDAWGMADDEDWGLMGFDFEDEEWDIREIDCE